MLTERATPETMSGVAIRADALAKSYRRQLRRGRGSQALAGCGFEVPSGSVTALVGANGAGKTTLLSILAGLLAPDSGRVHVAGRAVFVAQDKPVYHHLTPIGMLRVGARMNQVWDAARARAWLQRFDVPCSRRCGALSGGQRTQVALAVAMGACPDVLLLDEPFADLDPLVRRAVMTELPPLAGELGMTVVLSTHVIAELAGVANYLLLLGKGRTILKGYLDDVLGRHVLYHGPRAETPPGPGEVIEASHHGQQSRFLVRLPDNDAPRSVVEPWSLVPASLEDLVHAHLTTAS